jgi:hypothetical protein
LAWQGYSDATKQIIATSAPELGWSAETKQMIARWIDQLGWTKPRAGVEKNAPETVARISKEPATPSLQQAQEIRADIAAVRHTLEQELAHMREAVMQVLASQELIVSEISDLQATPARPPATERKPMPAPVPSSPSGPQSSRTAIPPH